MPHLYDELTDEAKKRARQDFVEEPDYPGYDWWCFEDFIEVGKCLGITFDELQYRNGPTIYFSGFSSQGDGASFEGRYKCRPDAVAAIKAYAPLDEELHRIAEELTVIQMQSKLRDGGSAVSAKITTRGWYNHSGMMNCTMSWTDNNGEYHEDCIVEEGLLQLFRDFADWIYKQLEAQYDYYFTDEYIEQELRDRAFEFDEFGTQL